MRFDFSNLCALRDTLGHLMERYEENENAFRQFYDAVAEKTLCPHFIGPIRIYDGRDAILEYIRWFYTTTPSVSPDDCTDALYLHLEEKIRCSDGEQIDPPTIRRVLAVVDNLSHSHRSCIPFSSPSWMLRWTGKMESPLPCSAMTVVAEPSFCIGCGMTLMAGLPLQRFCSMS